MWRWLRSGQQEWQDGLGCVVVLAVMIVGATVVGSGIAWLT